MSYYETKDSPMYHAMAPFFPQVRPSDAFLFALRDGLKEAGLYDMVGAVDFNPWLIENVGLIFDPDQSSPLSGREFRVVDEGLYAFALLRWS